MENKTKTKAITTTVKIYNITIVHSEVGACRILYKIIIWFLLSLIKQFNIRTHSLSSYLKINFEQQLQQQQQTSK